MAVKAVMAKRYLAAFGVAAMVCGSLTSIQAGGQKEEGTKKMAAPVRLEDLPEHQRPKAKIVKDFVPPKTPWGDPLLSGAYTNSDESGIAFERPAEFDGKRLEDLAPDELAKIVKQRQEQAIERAPTLSTFAGATSPMHWFENYQAANSRAWLVSDPPDGHVPPTTPESQSRAAARARLRASHGPSDGPEDHSLYDRCITRGIPGSMMPAIYGNSYAIYQGPGYVAIRYEMVNETRIIPLTSGPHLSPKIREYLGDAHGRWDGNTLVVETTNFTDKTAYRGSSEQLKLTERFKPIGPNAVEWSVTFDDPQTWTRPWTFAMILTKVPDAQGPFEYACHEGNYGLRNMLTAARKEEEDIKEAAAHGIVKAPSVQNPNEGER